MSNGYAVSRTINAGPQRIWDLLTDVPAYPSWNPAVVSLSGEIVAGQRIKLISAVNPKRTFTLTVSDIEPLRHMRWSSGMPLGLFAGVRMFSLRVLDDGQTEFTMREDYSGPLAGMIFKTIPDLTESFAQFADGLKIASEAARS